MRATVATVATDITELTELMEPMAVGEMERQAAREALVVQAAVQVNV